MASLIDPMRLRWVGFNHFEMDECGSLNEWLALAPEAEAVCGLLSARINVNDFALRPAHAMADNELLITGSYRFRFRRTPHVPHCSDAGLLFEETERTLLCSDLFLQRGDAAALTQSDVVDFRVFRPKEGDPSAGLAWRPVRRGIADLHRRAEVARKAAERYLDALASVDQDTTLDEVLRRFGEPQYWHGRRVRALSPLAPDDRQLIQAISRAEFTLNGLRNRDLQ